MVIFIIIFIIILFVVQYHSKGNSLKGIKYTYGFSKKLIEIGETTELISVVTNESQRIVSFIRMMESLPKGVRPLNRNVFIYEDALGLGYLRYESSIYLMARSKLQRKLQLTFDKRGRYTFGGAILRGGDFLGFTEQAENFHEFREIIVYPKAINAPQLQEIMGGFLGDISVRRFIMEDPILTIGTREYTGREPLKQMSWKHTARTNQMMVKQFDYTTEMVVTVFLDIARMRDQEVTSDQYESCFSLTRTVCQYLEQKKIPYEFVSNAFIEGAISDQSQNQSLGKAHLRLILEQLGRASYKTWRSYRAVIDQLVAEQEKNRSTIIITPQRHARKHQIAERLREDTTGSVTFIYGEDFHVPTAVTQDDDVSA